MRVRLAVAVVVALLAWRAGLALLVDAGNVAFLHWAGDAAPGSRVLGPATWPERWYRLAAAASGQREDLGRARARLRAQEGKWDEALARYARVSQTDPSQVTLFYEGVALRRVGRSLDALRVLDRSGYVAVIEKAASPDPGVPTTDRVDDLAALYAAASAEASNRGAWDAARQAGRRSLALTSVGLTRSPALEAMSRADEAEGRVPDALRWAWQSIAEAPGSASDVRYDRLSRLLLRWLGARTDQPLVLPAQAFGYWLRATQWLGKDREAATVGRAWLARKPADDPARTELVRCAVLESERRLDIAREISDTDLTRCVMPFEGSRPGQWGSRDVAMAAYPVSAPDGSGPGLLGVVVNRLDLELGLPIATQLYWSATGNGRDVTVTFGRLVNLSPNAGFEYDAMLGIAPPQRLPVGYQRDIYHAPESAREITALVGASPASTALYLKPNPMTRPDDAASGLSSFVLEPKGPGWYLLGARVSARGARVRLGYSTWLTRTKASRYGFVFDFTLYESVAVLPWTTVAGLIHLDSTVRGIQQWLVSMPSRGTAGFDDTILIRVPEPPHGQ